jgi:hypothetical protein
MNTWQVLQPMHTGGRGASWDNREWREGMMGVANKGRQRTLRNSGSNLVEPTRDQRNARVASRWKASTDQAPTTLLCSINIGRHRYIITTVPHTSMKLSQPIVHSYAANWTLDHEMFDKLRTTIFCLHVEIHAIKKFQEDSRRRSVTVRVSCWCIGVFNCPFTLLIRISRIANSLYIHTTLSRTHFLISNHLASVELFRPFTPSPIPTTVLRGLAGSQCNLGNT